MLDDVFETPDDMDEWDVDTSGFDAMYAEHSQIAEDASYDSAYDMNEGVEVGLGDYSGFECEEGDD